MICGTERTRFSMMCGAGNTIVSTFCGVGNTMISLICGTHHSTISSTFPLFRLMTTETWIRKNWRYFPHGAAGRRRGGAKQALKDWRAKLTAMCISIHRLKCLKRLMKTGLHIQIPSKTSGETPETSPFVIASGSVFSTTHISTKANQRSCVGNSLLRKPAVPEDSLTNNHVQATSDAPLAPMVLTRKMHEKKAPCAPRTCHEDVQSHQV